MFLSRRFSNIYRTRRHVRTCVRTTRYLPLRYRTLPGKRYINVRHERSEGMGGGGGGGSDFKNVNKRYGQKPVRISISVSAHAGFRAVLFAFRRRFSIIVLRISKAYENPNGIIPMIYRPDKTDNRAKSSTNPLRRTHTFLEKISTVEYLCYKSVRRLFQGAYR